VEELIELNLIRGRGMKKESMQCPCMMYQDSRIPQELPKSNNN